MGKGKKKKKQSLSIKNLSDEEILALKRELILEGTSGSSELRKEAIFFFFAVVFLGMIFYLVLQNIKGTGARGLESSKELRPLTQALGQAEYSEVNASNLSRSEALNVESQEGKAQSSDSSNGSAIRIPLSELSQNASFYSIEAAGKPIRFFVIRSSDGVYRSAFDACDVCYWAKLGYHQEGDDMVCNKCQKRFPSKYINDISGGCNPVPLERKIEGKELVIDEQALLAGTLYF